MDQTCLLFGHRNNRYALAVDWVREIVWLPDLSAAEELPPSIVGVFNLRGAVVPVMDLCLRFGHARLTYTLAERVIVLEGERGAVGIIASDLQEIATVSPSAIDLAAVDERDRGQARFILGHMKRDDGMVMLLDVAALLYSSPSADELQMDLTPSSAERLAQLYGAPSADQLAILQDRSRQLARIPGNAESAGQQTLVLVSLGAELYGLEVSSVREFAHLRACTPIPGCPTHIAGNMNLRGEILTLIDLRPVLGLTSAELLAELVVVQIGSLRFGLLVTEVIDVAKVAITEFSGLPANPGSGAASYCKDVVAFNGNAIGILDLDKMLLTRRLQVRPRLP